MFVGNIWPNSASLWEIRPPNVSDHEFNFLRPPKTKSERAVELPLYGFVFLKSKMRLNSAPLRDVMRYFAPWAVVVYTNVMIDPFKVTQGQIWCCRWTPQIWLSINLSNNTHVSISHCLALKQPENCPSYHWVKISDHPQITILTIGWFAQDVIISPGFPPKHIALDPVSLWLPRK